MTETSNVSLKYQLHTSPIRIRLFPSFLNICYRKYFPPGVMDFFFEHFWNKQITEHGRKTADPATQLRIRAKMIFFFPTRIDAAVLAYFI